MSKSLLSNIVTIARIALGFFISYNLWSCPNISHVAVGIWAFLMLVEALYAIYDYSQPKTKRPPVRNAKSNPNPSFNQLFGLLSLTLLLLLATTIFAIYVMYQAFQCQSVNNMILLIFLGLSIAQYFVD